MESRENQVSVKDAVKVAIDYVEDLYAENNLKNLLLEEVELSEADNQWLVTVGFSLPEMKEESTSLMMPSKRSLALSRRYKVVKVDATTGKPVSMKIRAI